MPPLLYELRRNYYPKKSSKVTRIIGQLLVSVFMFLATAARLLWHVPLMAMNESKNRASI